MLNEHAGVLSLECDVYMVGAAGIQYVTLFFLRIWGVQYSLVSLASFLRPDNKVSFLSARLGIAVYLLFPSH